MSVLAVENLKAGYGGARVLHGLSLTVDEGEVVVILGANGAGKTTTLRALSGVIKAQGRVVLDGRDMTGRRAEAFVRAGVAHVPEGRGTFMDLTVEENLRVGACTRKDAEIESDLERVYEWFEPLANRRSQIAGLMSGGEQQMLALARGLMLRPRLFLLDEPSLGLAPKITQQLYEHLAEIQKELNTTILLVEQNAKLALGMADRAYVLEAGTFVRSGSADEIAADESVREAYLGY